MENTKKKKHFIFDHPYLGGIISLFMLYVALQMAPVPAVIVFDIFTGEMPDTLIYLIVIAFAFFCLVIHRLWFKADGYKGAFKFTKLNVKDVWLCILIFAIVDVGGVAFQVATGVHDFHALVRPTISSIIMALCAGINEETFNRAIPGSIMMKNKPTYKRMIMAAIITSIFFGCIHFVNLTAGAGIAITLFQVAYAMCIGIFFVAIYFRTGSIILPMVMHSLHDIMSFVLPDQSTGVMLQQTVAFREVRMDLLTMVVVIILAIYLLRKSKWEDVEKIWAGIWNEEE